MGVRSLGGDKCDTCTSTINLKRMVIKDLPITGNMKTVVIGKNKKNNLKQ